MSIEKKTAVIYKTKYGSARIYAQWISEKLNGDLFEKRQAEINVIEKYDIIIYLGSLYAGGMLGISFIKKNFERLKNNRIILCSVGASYGQEKDLQGIINGNYTQKMKDAENISFFHLQGSLNYKRMGIIDRVLMFLLYQSVKRKDPETWTKDQKSIIGTYGKIADMTNEKNIQPILESLKVI